MKILRWIALWTALVGLGGCTIAVPPGAIEKLGKDLIPHVQSFAKSKEAIAGVNDAMSTLRALSNSSRKPKGQVDTKLGSSPTGNSGATGSKDEGIPDTAASDIKWFYVQTASQSTESATHYIDTEDYIEEGRAVSGGRETPIERYVTTHVYKNPKDQFKDGETPKVTTGTFNKVETIEISQYRELGTYTADGSYSYDNETGRSDTDGTMVFLSKDGGKSYTTTITTTMEDKDTFVWNVKGDNPGGGTLDVTSKSTFKGKILASGQKTGTEKFTQTGIVVDKKGETFTLESSFDTSYGTTTVWKGKFAIVVKDDIQLKFDTTDQSGSFSMTGQLYTADGKEKLADIDIDLEAKEGTLRFSDGTTDKLELGPVFDVIFNPI